MIVASVVNSIVIYSNTPHSVIRIPDLSNIATDPYGQAYHWKCVLINKISCITTNILNYGPPTLTRDLGPFCSPFLYPWRTNGTLTR